MIDKPLSEFNRDITLKTAIEMTERYRKHMPEVLTRDFAEKKVLPIRETFRKEVVMAILDQPGCIGLRTYYGMDENMLVHQILVGVNEKEEDMLPTGDQAELSTAGIAEDAKRCPDLCWPPSLLYP
ncbi:hypothetical protein [Flavihumibacter petaseus]|uniref:Uncharacterized protein n=1 Tax=Flavihumibacter petaseus NBRC 106054 TaxID=1220578 RepID=A0A0E9MYR0_9BACT|nr:hypothetical protein [Flavihumibacter petaseus]GAO42658.1 hypothetical protein FPE01S_01_16730 [Flavihumibacter petaseus NBRC 106054]